jgi:hypothetical protein
MTSDARRASSTLQSLPTASRRARACPAKGHKGRGRKREREEEGGSINLKIGSQ